MGDVENINVNSILNDDVGNVFSSISNSCEEVGDDGKCQVEVTL